MLLRILGELVRAEPLTALSFFVLLGLGAAYAVVPIGGGAKCGNLLSVPLLVIGLIHTGRSDTRFLHLAGRKPHRCFAAEYLILSIPVAVLLIGQGCAWKWPLAAVIAPLLIAILPAGSLLRILGRKPDRAPRRLPIPARSFEWITGMRLHGGALVLLYIIAGVFSSHPGVLLASLALLTWTVSLFHVFSEPRPLVEAFGKAPAAFLREKMQRSLMLFWVVSAPVGVLFVARHADLWLVLATVLFGTSLVHAGSVLARYATYREGAQARVMGPLSIFALTAAVLVLPVGLFLLYRFWRLALRNMENYLYDFH